MGLCLGHCPCIRSIHSEDDATRWSSCQCVVPMLLRVYITTIYSPSPYLVFIIKCVSNKPLVIWDNKRTCFGSFLGGVGHARIRINIDQLLLISRGARNFPRESSRSQRIFPRIFSSYKHNRPRNRVVFLVADCLLIFSWLIWTAANTVGNNSCLLSLQTVASRILGCLPNANAVSDQVWFVFILL